MKRGKVKYPRRFDLRSDDGYLKWRDEDRVVYPRAIDELVVELGGMTTPSPAQKRQILATVDHRFHAS